MPMPKRARRLVTAAQWLREDGDVWFVSRQPDELLAELLVGLAIVRKEVR